MKSLDDILEMAVKSGAASVLLLVGNPPAIRVDGKLRPADCDERLSYQETQKLAERVLSDHELNQLNETGAVEVPFAIGNACGSVNVFYAGGAHNLVFYLSAE